eukprot:c20014_g3_i2 orf=324-836(+)
MATSAVATPAPWIGAGLKPSLVHGSAAQSFTFPASMGAGGCRTAKSSSRPGAGATRGYTEFPTPARDHYYTLGVAPGASEEDIKRAYRRLALQYHPDVCKEGRCAALFMQINQAYKIAISARQWEETYPIDIYSEGLMGVNDDSWEDWEEWMGWEGAGTRDYSSHINCSF